MERGERAWKKLLITLATISLPFSGRAVESGEQWRQAENVFSFRFQLFLVKGSSVFSPTVRFSLKWSSSRIPRHPLPGKKATLRAMHILRERSWQKRTTGASFRSVSAGRVNRLVRYASAEANRSRPEIYYFRKIRSGIVGCPLSMRVMKGAGGE